MKQAFQNNNDLVRGCELLQTLDYQVSRSSAGSLISWLQTCNRVKDQNIEQIWSRIPSFDQDALIKLPEQGSSVFKLIKDISDYIESSAESKLEQKLEYHRNKQLVQKIEYLNSQIKELNDQLQAKEAQQAPSQKAQNAGVAPGEPGKSSSAKGQEELEQLQLQNNQIMQDKAKIEQELQQLVSEYSEFKESFEQQSVRVQEQNLYIQQLEQQVSIPHRLSAP